MEIEIIKYLTTRKITNLLKNRISYFLSLVTKKPKIIGYPVTLSIEPAAICQLHCPECILGSNQLKRKQIFIEQFLYKKIIDQTSDYLCYLMLYFQGEPFLSPHIFEMIKYASEKKIFTATSTNAQNIDEIMASKIVISGLKKLIISLDGVEQTSYQKYRIGGNFEKTLESIHNIKKEKEKNNSKYPIIELQFIVFKHNEKEIGKFIDLAKQLKVEKYTIKSAQIYNFENKTNLIPSIKKYSRYIYKNNQWQLNKKIKNHCIKSWQSAVITTEGDLVPCCYDKNAEYKYGNLIADSLFSLWHNETANKFRKRLLTNRSQITICKNCYE